MITQVDANNLNYEYKNLAFDYLNYCEWLDEENLGKPYYGISTNNTDIRNKNQWNNKGREIYDLQKLKHHSSQIIKIIDEYKLSRFLVQHSYMPFIWFPDFFIKDVSMLGKKNFLKNEIKGIDLEKFKGGFKITNLISDFINLYIDYPFLYKYKNIDFISYEIDMLISITHHLSIDFISSDIEIIKKIKFFCESLNLKYKLYN